MAQKEKLTIQNLPEELKEEYRRIFDSIDLDGSGAISLTELQKALKISEQQCQDLLRIGDTDADGELDWQEFFDLIMSAEISFGKSGVVMTPRSDAAAESLRFMCMLEERRQSVAIRRVKSQTIKMEALATERRSNRRASLAMDVLQEYIDLFNSLDKDGNGHVDIKELAEGLSISLEKSSYLMSKGDTDSNMMLDLTEFIDLMTDESTDLGDSPEATEPTEPIEPIERTTSPPMLRHASSTESLPIASGVEINAQTQAMEREGTGGRVPVIDIPDVVQGSVLPNRSGLAHEDTCTSHIGLSASDLDWLETQMPNGVGDTGEDSRTSTVRTVPASCRIRRGSDASGSKSRSGSVASITETGSGLSTPGSGATPARPASPSKIPSPKIRSRSGTPGALPPLVQPPSDIPSDAPPHSIPRQRSNSVSVNPTNGFSGLPAPVAVTRSESGGRGGRGRTGSVDHGVAAQRSRSASVSSVGSAGRIPVFNTRSGGSVQNVQSAPGLPRSPVRRRVGSVDHSAQKSPLRTCSANDVTPHQTRSLRQRAASVDHGCPMTPPRSPRAKQPPRSPPYSQPGVNTTTPTRGRGQSRDGGITAQIAGPRSGPVLGVRQVRRGSVPEPSQMRNAAQSVPGGGIGVQPATYRAPARHGVSKEQIPEMLLAEFQSVFDSIDADRNGTVSMEELTQCLGLNGDVARAIVFAGDKDGDRELNFDEFIEVMTDPRTQLDSDTNHITMLGQPFQTKSGGSLMLILQGSSFKQSGPLNLED